MHIAIEGMDGAGKTSAAKELAVRLGFEFVEKPMKYFTDFDGTMSNYLRMMEWLNEGPSKNLRAWFYGCGSILTNVLYSGKNIITDRYLISNYFWNCDGTNEDYYAALIRAARIPEITVILRASDETRKERITGRDENDKDLKKTMGADESYAKMIHCANTYAMPYTVVDNSHMNLAQTVGYIECLLKTEGLIQL